jgi:hypothetical protein
MIKLVITYNPPPIPDRNFDFQCVLDTYEPGDIIGFGRDVIESVQDLVTQLENA